ncbi:MAG: GMC family oxidoreductase [Candidatus Methanomethyliaceae archaeon]|nr:GMC family oxidoreductase [Candidatus Methanomethyliaceae archaeon]
MFDFIVVGSGAGGATIAKELALAGRKVLIIEEGRNVPAERAAETYRIAPSGVEIWQTVCLGGTTLVSMGNAVRGVHEKLESYYLETEKEMGVTPVPESHMGNGTRLLLSVSKDWRFMPKAIDFSKCKSCGKCPLGCPHGAKWDANAYVQKAKASGAQIITETPIKRVLIVGEKAVGVESFDGKTFKANNIVLCAGAIETPRILMRSGIEGAGSGLYVDTFITVGGIMEGICLSGELNMSLFIKREGYLLSPHYSSFIVPYLMSKGYKVRPIDILGIMVKIADEPTGSVEEGRVIKGLSNRDVDLLYRGRKEAEEILIRAGVDAESIVSTYPRGVHPGGTCCSLVKGLEPLIESLYISDASVIPGPFGIPPILTIVAMSKNIADILTGRA